MTETARTTQPAEATSPMTVGQVAERYGVTVRTLHHYDAIGLLAPSGRSAAGYRLYTDADLSRLHQVVVYRRLGFSLDEIADLLDDPDADVADHLRRQREAVTARLEEMRGLVTALDNALEALMSGSKLTDDEQRELFGDVIYDDYAAEAERRWGDTDQWREHQRRTATYTKADWAQIMTEAAAVSESFAAAMRAGQPPTSEAAMDAAQAHWRHINAHFYAMSYAMHRGLGDMFAGDPAFAQHYENRKPGLAQYVRDAIHANADRHGSG